MDDACNHIIGLWVDYENTQTITLWGLQQKIKEQEETYAYCLNDPIWKKESDKFKPKWTLHDYCDRRRVTNLVRFNFCPSCGHKIDWKEKK